MNARLTAASSKLFVSSLVTSALLASAPSAIAGTSDWEDGDVFVAHVAFPNDGWSVYDHAGVFKEFVATPSYPYEHPRAAFRGNGNLCSIALQSQDDPRYHVVTLDRNHPHTLVQDVNVHADGVHDATSIALDALEQFYVSTLGLDGSAEVHRYSAAGVHQETYTVAYNGTQGVQSIALSSDQHTLYYVANQEPNSGFVKRYDVATHTQLADLVTSASWIYDLILLPPFDGSGGFIVAQSSLLRRYDAAGASVQVYDAPGHHGYRTLSLDADGASFWTTGIEDATSFPRVLYRFDIATGALAQDTQAIGNDEPYDLIVRGELVGGSLAPQFDAPTPCESSVHAYVGVPFTFSVSGSDLNDGDTVTLDVSALPGGATMTPSLPVSANPAQSTLNWTPAANETGDYSITYTITDFSGHERTCTLSVTVEPGEPYCFGDGLDPLVTATCPCGNDGFAGHGCANSNPALGGAQLSASGAISPNTIVLTCTGVNNNTLCTFLRSQNHDVQAAVFGDGIKCITTPTLRFGQQNSGQGGNEMFTVSVPAPTELPGRTFHYAVQYRNPVGGYCLPALFNASNGYTIAW